MSLYVLVTEEIAENRRKSCNFFRLVTAYRQHAHKDADINPVSLSKNIRYFFLYMKSNDFLKIFCYSFQPELDLKLYGLNENQVVNFKGIINTEKTEGTVAEAIDFLKNVYGKTLSAEFTHLEVKY